MSCRSRPGRRVCGTATRPPLSSIVRVSSATGTFPRHTAVLGIRIAADVLEPCLPARHPSRTYPRYTLLSLRVRVSYPSNNTLLCQLSITRTILRRRTACPHSQSRHMLTVSSLSTRMHRCVKSRALISMLSCGTLGLFQRRVKESWAAHGRAVTMIGILVTLAKHVEAVLSFDLGRGTVGVKMEII